MTSVLLKLLPLIALSAIVACAKSGDSGGGAPNATPGPKDSAPPASPTPAAPGSPVSLDGMEAAALLPAKYSNAEFVCEVRIQHAKEFDAAAAPKAVLKWDLLKEFAPSRSLKVIDGIPNMDIAVLINVKDVTIVDQKVDNVGTPYELTRSPKLAIEFFDSGRAMMKAGYAEWIGEAKEGTIHERIPAVIIDRVQVDTKSPGRLSYFENVSCLFMTTPKAEFAAQFKPAP